MPQFNPKKKFKITASAITKNDLTSVQDTIETKITTTSTNLVSDAENNYLNATGDTMLGVLSFENGSYLQFPDNSIQTIAYSADKDTTLSTVNSKSAGFSNINNATVFSQPAIFSALEVPTSSLPITAITDLSGELHDLDTRLITVKVNTDTNTSDLTIAKADIQNLYLADISTYQKIQSQDISINQINTHIDQLETDISNSITAINLQLGNHTSRLNISDVSINQLTSLVGSNTSAISDLSTNKVNVTTFDALANRLININYDLDHSQTIISSLASPYIFVNELDVSTNVNISGSCRISNVNYELTDSQFGYLSSIDSDYITTISHIHTDISANTESIGQLNVKVDANTTDISAIELDISQHSMTLASHSNLITDISSALSTAILDISTSKTTEQVLTGYISALQNLTTQHTNDIATHSTLINSKQDAITLSNKLDAGLIGDGTISNQMYQTLYGIDTTKTIQAQINTIKNSLSTLTENDNTDISNIAILNTFASNQAQKNLQIDQSINIISSSLSNLNELQNLDISNFLNISSVLSTNASTIATLNNFKTDQEAYNTTNNTNIQNIQNTIDTLQLYDISNQLSGDFVNVSYINSIYDSNPDSNVNTEFVNIRDAINLSHSQLLTVIETKQNLINNDAKLPSPFISGYYRNGASTLDQIIFDIDTNLVDGLNSKQNTISNTNKISSDFISTNLNNNVSNLSSVLVDIEDNFVDIFTGKQDTLNSTTNKLPIANVDLTSSSLAYIDISSSLQSQLSSIVSINTSQTNSITNINDAITSLQNVDAGFNTRIQANETNISSLQAHDLILDGQISSINTAVLSKQPTISSTNKLSSGLVATNVNNVSGTLDAVLTTFDSDLTSLDNGKQNLITSSNKLPISLVDLSGSTLAYADYNSSIASKFSSLDGQISTLTTLQNGDIANFDTIDMNFQSIDSQLLLKQDLLSANNKLNPSYINAGSGNMTSTKMQFLSSITGDIMTLINSSGGSGSSSASYPSITYDSSNNTTTISNDLVLGSALKFSDGSIQSTAFSDSKITDLSNVKTTLTNITYGANNTTIGGTLTANTIVSSTLDTINSNVTTNANSISSLSTRVNDISTNVSTINSNVATINSSITALQTYDTNQTTLNTQVSNDITTLYNTKQNVLSDTSKLNPAYIDAGTGSLTTTKLQNLSSITSDLQTQLDGKQANITDGSLTIARTSGLQSALNGKLNNTGGTMTGDLNFSNSASITGAQVIRCNFIQSSIGTNCFACDNTTGVVFNTLTDVPSVGNFSILAGDLANKFLFYSSSSARNAYLPHPTSFNSNGAFVGINMANTGASAWTFGVRIEGSTANIYSISISAGSNVGAIFACNGTNWRIFNRL